MRSFLGILAILIAGSLYGSLNSIVKLAYADGFSFPQVTYSQYVYGALGLAILVVITRSYRKMPLKAFLQLSFIGFVGLGGTSLFLYASLDSLSASMALVLLFQFTWISLIIERLFLKKKVNLQQIVSVLIILVGTVLVLQLTHFQNLSFSLVGILLGLGAAVCYAAFLIGSSVLPKAVPPFYQSFIMVAINVVILFILFAPFQSNVSVINPFSSIWLWGLILGLLGQFLPPLLFTYGAPIVGGTMTSILGSIELPVGVLVSALVLHESIHPIQWGGILLILGGIVFSQLKLRKTNRL